jgi:hypothetical protein
MKERWHKVVFNTDCFAQSQARKAARPILVAYTAQDFNYVAFLGINCRWLPRRSRLPLGTFLTLLVPQEK